MAEKTKDKKAAAADDGEEATGGRKKLLVMALVAVLALAGAAYFFLFASSGEAGAEEPVSSGTFLTLDPVAVNLAGGGYLKVGVSLELTEAAAGGGHGGSSVDGAKALDLVIATFSQAQPADVTGARDALKAALEQRIVEAYTEDGHAMVMGIYFTEYVTQ